ncbi:EAL domain-containing protein [Cupriavidus sp. 2TAF22]|uniref:EAL domain-containing protein n=1 Tax=unclassified Cupriavidus TaxID=2640874 RepID=UPI003F93C1BC
MPNASSLAGVPLPRLRLPPLHAVFQPIVTFGSGEILGYEALVRGPSGTPLAMPDALFRLARNEADTVELELQAARAALSGCAALDLQGKLFLNFSATALRYLLADGGRAMAALVAGNIAPARVVIEVTEHAQIEHAERFGRSMAVLHEMGMQYALDDFGTGHANLDRLIHLAPHYIKLDKSLVRDIGTCSRRLEVVRTVLALVEALGGAAIAEGIEDADELAVLRDLGVPFGQGYYLGRPQAQPVREVAPQARLALVSKQIAVFPQAVRSARPGMSAGKLMRPGPAVRPGTTNNELLALFHAHPELHAAAVVSDDDKPLAIVNRHYFIDRFAGPFHRELYGRKDCLALANRAPLCFDKGAGIDEMAQALSGEDQRALADGFIITERGRYAGLGTGADLIRAVTEIRMEAARYANPLTFLPGNMPLNRHIDRLVEAGAEFHACYIDLNHFKPYNDQYGYWKGDEMLKGAAAFLAQACDPVRDFLGHVGGDDFLVLYQSPDWEARTRTAIARFDLAARELYSDADREAGGIHGEDRLGQRAFFPTVTMAAGAVRVGPRGPSGPQGMPGLWRLDSSHIGAAAAAAKRAAKKASSGFVVIDLRELARDGRLGAPASGQAAAPYLASRGGGRAW